MITIGVDAHKRIHVALALDEAGRLARERLFAAVTAVRVIDASVLGALRRRRWGSVHDSGRWGDYLGGAVDPADPSKVWVVGEYAKDDGFVFWGTFIGSVSYSGSGICPSQPAPPPPPPPPPNDNFADRVVISGPLRLNVRR